MLNQRSILKKELITTARIPVIAPLRTAIIIVRRKCKNSLKKDWELAFSMVLRYLVGVLYCGFIRVLL
jgi:hypothetical protein